MGIDSHYYLVYICISNYNKQFKTNVMTTYNNTITIEEARQLLNAETMTYPATDHNKKMIATATREFLQTLRK